MLKNQVGVTTHAVLCEKTANLNGSNHSAGAFEERIASTIPQESGSGIH
jgi:hypothetical protein